MSCKLIYLGEGKNAIICGVPDECKHDDNGSWMVNLYNKETDEEEWVPKEEFPFYSPNSEEEEKANQEFLRGRVIVGGSCSCSKCGALAIANMNMWF